MTARRLRGGVLLTAVASLVIAGCSSGGSAAPPSSVEQSTLHVGVVPSADSAGFFIALHQGLFKAQGLTIDWTPAVSSEVVINQQAMSQPGSSNELDITEGNYVSYIQAEQNWLNGEKPSTSPGAEPSADLDIFAEGSVMEPGAQGIYTLPNSPIRTLAQLEGKKIGINAPNNILFLLAASVLVSHGVPVSTPGNMVAHSPHFVPVPFQDMVPDLKNGTLAAAMLPEPFASDAAQDVGAATLIDLNEGTTAGFPVAGYAVTKTWANAHPKTLAAFYRALEQGQQIADTDRAAVEQALESLPAPYSVSKQTAAVMALDNYPVSDGPVGTVDSLRLQRVVTVMESFINFNQHFEIRNMLVNNGNGLTGG